MNLVQRRLMAGVLVAVVALFAAGLVLFVHQKKSADLTEECMANLRILWKAACMYSPGGAEQFPPSLQSLVQYAPDLKWYVCPCSGHAPGSRTNVTVWSEYVYVAGRTIADDPDRVLAYCPPANHAGKGASVLFVDGSVVWITPEAFDALTNSPSLSIKRGPIEGTHEKRSSSDGGLL